MNVDALVAKRAAPQQNVIAGNATSDDAAVTGIIIDRNTTNHSGFVAFLFPYTTTLAANKSFSFANMTVETSAESNMANASNLYFKAAATEIAKGGAGGTTETGVYKLGVPLGGAKRYLRLKYTPGLNASGTDTADLTALAVFNPPYVQPAGN